MGKKKVFAFLAKMRVSVAFVMKCCFPSEHIIKYHLLIIIYT